MILIYILLTMTGRPFIVCIFCSDIILIRYIINIKGPVTSALRLHNSYIPLTVIMIISVHTAFLLTTHRLITFTFMISPLYFT